MMQTKRVYWPWVVVLVLIVVAGGVWRGLQKPSPVVSDDPPIEIEERTVMEAPRPAVRDMPVVSEEPREVAPFPEPAADVPPPRDSGSQRVDSLLAAGLPRQEQPWVDLRGHPLMPSPADGMIRSLAGEVKESAGPETLLHARNLLNSEQEGVGLIGVALMMDQPDWAWDPELFQRLAGHHDSSVPLYALRALLDAGHTEGYERLHDMVRDRFSDSDWPGLLQGGEWTGTSLRGLLDIARETGDAERRQELISALLEAEAVDYGARMQALLELRELLPFEEFREAVREEYHQTLGDDLSIWQLGLAELLQRLEGPVEIVGQPEILTRTDIDLMVAKENPAMYENIALRLEQMLRDPHSRFHLGVFERIEAMIAQARQFPLSDDEDDALSRIEVLLPRIVETDESRRVLPPPPGS